MGPEGADGVKSRTYNLMLVRSSPAANILDILVLMYHIFVKNSIFKKNYTKSTRKEWATMLTDN